MKKQITTVYVPTEQGKRFTEMLYRDGGLIEWSNVYLYSHAEHLAAKQALSKAEDKGEGVRTIDGCLTCVHNIDTFEGNSFCIHNCNKGSMYELYVCKVQPSRTTKPTNSLDELERWANEDGSDFITIDDIRRKIKSLKIINY